MNISSGGSAQPNHFAAYGDELQARLDHYAGSCVTGSIYGERVARYENKVSINKNILDAWGIPTLHIDVKDSDNELNMAKDSPTRWRKSSKRPAGRSSRRPTSSTHRATASTKWVRRAWATTPKPAF